MRWFILIYSLLICFSMSGQGKKSLVELALSVTDSQGNPVSGTFSLSVTDAAVVKPDTIQPMLDSYMLLNSELKGNIENPNYYFKAPDRRTAHHLDLLMMTQGWRRYNLNNIIKGEYPEILHSIETGQTISGEVKGTMGNKVRNVNLHLVNTKNGRQDIMLLKSSSKFIITGMNFVDGTAFVLQAIRPSGGHGDMELKVNEFIYPNISHDVLPCQEMLSMKVPSTYIHETKKQLTYDEEYDVIELDEVLKTTKRIYKSRGKLGIEPSRGFREGDKNIELFPDMNSLFTRLGMRIHVDNEGGETLTHAMNRSSLKGITPVRIYIDDHPVSFDNARTLHPTDVKSIEYYPPGNAQVGVYGNGAVHGGLLLIFQKDGTEQMHHTPLSVKSITPKGYKPAMEFYSPQYPAKDKSIYTRPDHRTTLYWNPRVMTDEEGKASVSFYSSDVSKKYLVTLEGLTDDGVAISEVIQF